MKKNKTITPRFSKASHFVSFWEKGNGKRLITWSGAQPSFGDFDKYAPLYYRVDDLGDRVVEDLYLQKPYAVASKEIEDYIRRGISKKDSVPDSVKELFSFSECVPHWVDERLLKAGAEVSMRSGLNAFISLRDYTLLGGYDYAYLNKPLVFTGALRQGPMKRLSETLDFWIAVTRVHALRVHGKGYGAAIKTRLIHSLARLKIKEHCKDWDYENFGEPLNMWDMTATSHGFSLIFLHGLYKLGFEFSKEEEAGVFHLWKYIGYLLGIPSELLPDNKKEATERFYLWSAVQAAGDEDSISLATALVRESIDYSVYNHRFRRRLMNYIHGSSAGFLLDSEVKRRLQIPEVKNKDFFPSALSFVNQVAGGMVSRHRSISRGNEAQLSALRDYQRLIKKRPAL